MAKTGSRMKRLSSAIGVLVASAFAVTGALAQPASPDISETVQLWLLDSCGLDRTPGIEARLISFGPEAAPALIEAFQAGPDDELKSQVRASAADRFRQRQQLLKSDVDTGLSKEALASAAADTQNSFVERQGRDFELRYRSQALAGLGMTGGPRAREFLQRVVTEADPDFQTTAAEALQKLGR